MLYRKLPGVKQQKNWSYFYDKLANHEKLLDFYQINYAKRRSYTLEVQRQFIPEKKGIRLTMIPEVKNPVYYTLDGRDPTKNSKICVQPLFVNKTCSIKACVFNKDGKTDQVSTNYFRAHQAVGLKVDYGSNYTDLNGFSLTDGQLDSWTQFEAKDLNFTIDLGKIKHVKNLETTL